MEDPLSTPWFVVLLLLDAGLLLFLGAIQAAWLRPPIGDLLALKRSHQERASLFQRLIQKRSLLGLAVHFYQVLLHGLWAVLWLAWLPALPWSTPQRLGLLAAATVVLALVETGVAAYVQAHWQAWAVRLAPWAVQVMRFAQPLAGLLRLFPMQQETVPLTLSQETFIALLEAAGYSRLRSPLLRMMYAILRLRQTLVREIMVPRVDMVTIHVETPLREALRVFIETGFSRLPVYENKVDRILGVLYGKDLLPLCLEGSWDKTSIRDLLREPYFVPEAKRLDELLQEMQARRIHMAIVIDEYGGVAGLVTLEDIMEEIVGEIHDEYDQPEQAYQRLSENEYLFTGRIDIDDFNDIMGTHLDRNVADTLGGFIFTRLGRIPEEGAQVEEEGLSMIVEKVQGHRILQVRVKRKPQLAAPAPEEGTP